MLSRIGRYFRERLEIDPAASAAPNAERIQLAAAALLVEVARADFDYAGDERAHIAELITQTLGVAPAEVQALQALAEAESESSTSLHEFTSLVHEHFSDVQKASLMESLWRVAYADGQVDKREEYLLRRIADLLYLPHETYIRARHRVEDGLG